MRHRLVLDEIPEKGVAVLTNWCFQRDRMSGDVEHLPHLVIRYIHGAGNLELGWLSLEDLLQPVPRLLDPIDGLADMDREPDRAALIRNGAGDGLPNPPRGIS